MYPTAHCLRRDMNRMTFSAFYTKAALNAVIFDPYSAYSHFNSLMQQAPNVANAITPFGGGFSDIASPNDPIFFLNLAQIDRVWALWQQSRKQFNKPSNEFNGVWKNRLVRLDDEIEPFGVTVRQVIDSANQLCYVYALPGTAV